MTTIEDTVCTVGYAHAGGIDHSVDDHTARWLCFLVIVFFVWVMFWCNLRVDQS